MAVAPAERSSEDLRRDAEQRFEADPPDRHGGGRARDQAERGLIASLPAGATLRSLECRASICRAEIQQVDLAGHRAFLERARPAGDGWDGPIMTTLAPRGASDPWLTIVYLGRTATALADAVPIEALEMAPGE